MRLNEYQEAALTTAVYPKTSGRVYLTLGLCGEAGELANKAKKEIRDNVDKSDELRDELSDCLWYVSCLANDLGVSLEDLAKQNLEKLRGRKARGTLGGDGDVR